MTTPEEWMKIKTLAKKGFSQRKIAKTLGLSRNTVKRHLTEEHPPHYQRAVPYPSMLDDYRDYLSERLQAYPTLSADRLYRELLERGYRGSYETVARYIRNHLSRKVRKLMNVLRPIRVFRLRWIGVNVQNRSCIMGLSARFMYSA